MDLFLEHLVPINAADFIPEIASVESFTSIDALSPAQTLDAQKKTSDWIKSFDDEDDAILTTAQEEKVGEVFAGLVTSDPSVKNKMLQMQVPEEVQAAVSMVTGYQWKFIEQADELRSMAVSHIVKEIQHPDAKVRLKALELLGKVTEVALFTDRIEVKRQEMSDDDLEKRIKEKLSKYMGVADVVDVIEMQEKTSES